MNGRLYTVRTGFQTVSAAQDLIELLAGTTTPFLLHYLGISQSSDAGDAEAELLQVALKRGSGSYTSGSGGGALTVVKHLLGDAADAFAGEERNNTTQATAGTGALGTLFEEAMNVQAGWQFLPPPSFNNFFNISQALILSLSAPADALTLQAMAIIEELG